MTFSSPVWIGLTLFVVIVGILCGTADGTFFNNDTTNSLETLAGKEEFNVNTISTLPSTIWNMVQWKQSFFTDDASIGRYLRPIMFGITLFILIPFAILIFSTIKSIIGSLTGGAV